MKFCSKGPQLRKSETVKIESIVKPKKSEKLKMSDLFGYNGEALVCAGSMNYNLSSSSREIVALKADVAKSITISSETVNMDLTYAIISTFYIVAEA